MFCMQLLSLPCQENGKEKHFALGDRLELDISSNGIKEYLLQNYLTLSIIIFFFTDVACIRAE